MGNAFVYPLNLFPICVACCAGGLKNIVYAFGLGYGLSMTANGLLAYLNFDPSRFKSQAAVLARAGHMLGYVTYGLRLFIFLYMRQASDSYSGKMNDLQAKSDNMSIAPKSMIVVSVGLLMALYQAPVYYHAKSAARPNAVTWLGTALWIAGLAVESVADAQKMASKQSSPGSFVATGLFRYVRHANYFGEILYHIGMYLNGFPSYETWWQVGLRPTTKILHWNPPHQCSQPNLTLLCRW